MHHKNFLMTTSIFWSLTGRSSSLFQRQNCTQSNLHFFAIKLFYFGLMTSTFTFEQDNFYKTNAQLPPIWTLLARFIFTFGAFYTDFIYVYLSKFISWWRHLVSRLCILPLVVPPQQLETQMREMYFGLQFPFFLFLL